MLSVAEVVAQVERAAVWSNVVDVTRIMRFLERRQPRLTYDRRGRVRLTTGKQKLKLIREVVRKLEERGFRVRVERRKKRYLILAFKRAPE